MSVFSQSALARPESGPIEKFICVENTPTKIEMKISAGGASRVPIFIAPNVAFFKCLLSTATLVV